ncbi:conserved hypothetical protein [Leptospira interrogans serovar Manilae]|uniref:Uncharacterized protein n=1 Tax=Leptospira interrogans serovar Manilae TaxID=214675 RepID=A0AAQ1NU94_LEPIR|nr:conserved hypothetical protein [Leptospira interrogans serovar Manilae]
MVVPTFKKSICKVQVCNSSYILFLYIKIDFHKEAFYAKLTLTRFRVLVIVKF